MSTTISVQLDALEALSGELTTLAGELSDDADRCASTVHAFLTGLNGDVCLEAIGAAGTWAALARTVADGTRVAGATLSAAVAAYRAAEEARAEGISRRRLQFAAVAW